jgi:hypothetical protein
MSDDQRPAKLSFTPEGGEPFYVQYNPTQMKINKGIAWKDAENLGPDEPALQFTTPKPMTITLELIFDTTFEGAGAETSMNLGERLEQGMASVAAAATSAVSSLPGMGGAAEDIPDGIYPDVRKLWVNHLTAMTISGEKSGSGDSAEWKSPPVVTVMWKDLAFEAVISKLDTTYTMFASDGTPVRATVSLELKENKLTSSVDTAEMGSPMLAEKVQLLNPDHGENVFSLAMKFGLDWRMIALANNIDDPTDIADNMDLIIPMVTGGKL